MGFALYLAQSGDKHDFAKPLHGSRGAGVLEVVDDFDGDTYRTVYTVRFSDALMAKAALARQIASIATHRHLTQAETARVLGTTQPKVSDLWAGKLAGFSMERLIRFLNALDRDVRIVVTPKPRSRGRSAPRLPAYPSVHAHLRLSQDPAQEGPRLPGRLPVEGRCG